MITGLRIADQLLMTGSLALPALVLLYRRRLLPRLHLAWIFLACCVVVYAMLLAQAYVIDLRFERELLAFDLDGNDWFTPDEETPAQKHAMENVVNDTARTLAPITGLILSPLLVTLAFGIVVLARGMRRLAARLMSRAS